MNVELIANFHNFSLLVLLVADNEETVAFVAHLNG